MKITLIACTVDKNNFEGEAQEVYTSEMFKYARLYCERTSDKWFILSGKYFLLKPTDIIKPYKMPSVTRMPRAWRYWFSKNVYEKLKPELTEGDTIEFICGFKYRSFLVEWLEKDGYKIETPYEGIGIGETTSILRRKLL